MQALTRTIVIPLSLDYTLAMGEFSAASGAILGVSLPAQYIGYRIGDWMWTDATIAQSDYHRRTLVVCHLMALLSYLGLTLLLQSAEHSGLASRRTFWIALCVQVAGTIFGSVSSRLWRYVRNQASTEEKYDPDTALCAGLLCGPLCAACMVHQIQSLTPVGMMACVFAVVLAGHAVMTAATAFTILPFSRLEVPPGQGSKNDGLPLGQDPTTKERLVWNLIIYFYEHNISVIASECGVVVVLEIIYGWSVAACALAMFTQQMGRLLTVKLLATLLNGPQFTPSELLLVADTIVYSVTSAGAFPTRDWTEEGKMDEWLQAEWRWQKGHAAPVCSLLVSILIRFLVYKGGRNSYATFQLVTTFLAMCTVVKAVSLKEDVDNPELRVPEG
ncbi:unnamed protein product [Symbiodinium necroappetens]|uniref:Uncharacterized protein n=1 Tax=Symbiodinium necroappetens TaxID=1628268 RepID=A0A812MS85_9DINO|nr:unnamed protein product [Symbiodinium necroappetens]